MRRGAAASRPWLGLVGWPLARSWPSRSRCRRSSAGRCWRGRRGASPTATSRRCTATGSRSCSARARCRRSLIALLGWRYAADLAERLPWRRLLAASYVVGAGVAALARVRRRADGHLAGAGQPLRVPRRPPARSTTCPRLLHDVRRPDPARRRPTTGRPTSPATRRARCCSSSGSSGSGSAATSPPGWSSRCSPRPPRSRCWSTLRALGAEPRGPAGGAVPGADPGRGLHGRLRGRALRGRRRLGPGPPRARRDRLRRDARLVAGRCSPGCCSAPR